MDECRLGNPNWVLGIRLIVGLGMFSIMHTVHPDWYHIIQCQRQKVYNEDGSWLCECGQEIYWRMFASVRKTIHFCDDFNGLQSMTFGDWFRQSLDNTALPSGLWSLTVGDALANSRRRLNTTRISCIPCQAQGTMQAPSTRHRAPGTEDRAPFIGCQASRIGHRGFSLEL